MNERDRIAHRLEIGPEDMVELTAMVRRAAVEDGNRGYDGMNAAMDAYRLGRRSGLRGFAKHLRGMAQRGVNERITESLLAIADIADREAEGKP